MHRYVLSIVILALITGATYAQRQTFNIERQAVTLRFEHDLGFPTGVTTFELTLDCSSGVTTAEPLEHVQVLKDELGLQLPGDSIHITHLLSPYGDDLGPKPNEVEFVCVDGVMRFYHHASDDHLTHTCRMRTIFGRPDAPSYAPRVPQGAVPEDRPTGSVDIWFRADARIDNLASSDVDEYCFINDSSLGVTFGYSVGDLSIRVPETPALSYDNAPIVPELARSISNIRGSVSYVDGRIGYLGILHETPTTPSSTLSSRTAIATLNSTSRFLTPSPGIGRKT